MRTTVLVMSAVAILACGKGEQPEAITGKTWDVRMVAAGDSYRFAPATLTIKRGDGVRWTLVAGPVHTVTFWPDSIPPGASSVLRRNMPQTSAPLASPLLVNPSQTYVVSFAGVPPGTYHYYCAPHLMFGMIGTIVVQ